MSDSLLVAGIETLGGTSQSTYKVSTGAMDFGAVEPDQATIVRLLLDGDPVTGSRSKNRQINLQINVFASGATSQLTRAALGTACDALLSAVNQATFTMQWTPDGGLPVIWDCYRGRGQRQRTIVRENQGVSQITLTIQAMPFGRSPDSQSLTLTTTLQVDSFDTAPTGGTLDTTTKYEGTGSARYTNGSPVSRTFTAKDLSAFDRLSFKHYGIANIGLSQVNVHGSLTLTSASGSTTYPIATNSALSRTWMVVTALFSTGTVTSGTGVTLTAVTSYSLTLTASASGGVSQLNVDDLRASGASQAQVTTTNAELLLAPGVVGSARTPVNIALTNGATFNDFLLHSPPSTQDPAAAILTGLNNTLADQTITIAAANAKFAGTYLLMLTEAAGGTTETITVTVTQLENGTAVGAAKVLTTSYSFSGGTPLIPVGLITLPLYQVPADNTQTTFTVRAQSSGVTRFHELMLLDTRGQTIYSDVPPTVTSAAVYVDEPSPLQTAPSVYRSASGRAAAYNMAGECLIEGGPIIFEPATNKLLVWVDTGAPAVSATYYPRWVDERTV